MIHTVHQIAEDYRSFFIVWCSVPKAETCSILPQKSLVQYKAE